MFLKEPPDELCPVLQSGYLFDHPGTVLFSVFMSFWAVTFLEYWKRKMATLAHHWDCMDFHEEEVSLSLLSLTQSADPRCEASQTSLGVFILVQLK